MFRNIVVTIIAAASLAVFCGTAAAMSVPFDQWLTGVRAEALQKGISQQTVDAALTGISPIPKVIELDRKQPEKKWTFAEYRKNVINDARIRQGREMMQKHSALLGEMSKRYGVQPQYIVALWGIETSYGQNFGSYNIVESLATLAWEGRRADFFRAELFNALKIIDQGHISAADMKGSWAGAMGHNQFMPSSFLNFAQDGNGDGSKNIWASLPDVFASTANYLARSGWKDGERWGRQVRLSPRIAETMTGLDGGKSKTLDQWRELGVTLYDGNVLPAAPDINAYVVVPDGLSGPAYLVYDNYKVIMKWNRSTYFATSVGIIADAIAGSSS